MRSSRAPISPAAVARLATLPGTFAPPGRAAAALRSLSVALAVASVALATPVRGLAAQQAAGAAKAGEVASMLDLALTEYAAAVDGGRVVNRMEYAESREFTRRAGEIFAELAGPEGGGRARTVAARIDSLSAVVEAKGRVERYRRLVERVNADLAEGWRAVSVPEPDRRPSAARGAELYRRACAACHGPAGGGNGWAADGMQPPPADLTSELRHREATPARDYQVTMYGVPETAMPASRDWLSPEGAWDLVAYVQSLRFGASEVAEGKALALETEGGSPVAGSLRRWSSPTTTARLTDGDLAQRIRARWGAATGRSGGSAADGPRAGGARDSLSREQADALVAYARTLLGTPRTGVPETGRSAALAERLERADSLAAAAARLARGGESSEVRGVALQGYMAFEGVEPDLRALAPELVADVEAAFSDLREARDAEAAESAAARVRELLGRAEIELEGPASAWTAANRSFFIILREGFEAILIIGAVLAFLVKTGNEERKSDVYWGVGVALAASLATAAVFQRVMASAPVSRELLEGGVMLLAVAVLFSVSYWLISKLEHEKWEAYLRTKMQSALGAGSGLALAGVAFLAVYREGFESVIFYAALLSHPSTGVMPVAAGFLVGCVVLAAIYLLFTHYGVKIPMRPFFAVTSAVLYYMAVVFAGSGFRELQEAGVVGRTAVEGVPSVPLLGIHPTVETLAAQGVLVVLLVGALVWTFAPRRRAASGSPASG